MEQSLTEELNSMMQSVSKNIGVVIITCSSMISLLSRFTPAEIAKFFI